MKTVCIESPFRNPLPEVPLIGELYRDYLHDCLRDSLSRGEAPFAGHAYLTQVLGDDDEAERRQGIDCHLAWLRAADEVIGYIDFGISPGMVQAMRAAKQSTVRHQRLPAWTDIGEYTQGFIAGWQRSRWLMTLRGGYGDGEQRNPKRFRP